MNQSLSKARLYVIPLMTRQSLALKWSFFRRSAIFSLSILLPNQGKSRVVNLIKGPKICKKIPWMDYYFKWHFWGKIVKVVCYSQKRPSATLRLHNNIERLSSSFLLLSLFRALTFQNDLEIKFNAQLKSLFMTRAKVFCILERRRKLFTPIFKPPRKLGERYQVGR